ncbi:MAG: flagellar export protein FliJ [SAR324 cluster bacterium]|nr:flagellar export protein FliJ [SAR324 cluster bacterium]
MPKFSLQTALDVRERIEKLKQKEFAEQLQIAQEIKSRIDACDSELQQSRHEVNQMKNRGFTIGHLQFHDQFKKRIAQQTEVLEQQLVEQNELLEVNQKNLLKATQDRRALEILKEKELTRAREKQERTERTEMDEIAQNFLLSQK